MWKFHYLFVLPPEGLPPLRTPCSSSPPRCWPLPARRRQSATGPSPTTRRNSPRPGFKYVEKMKISGKLNFFCYTRTLHMKAIAKSKTAFPIILDLFSDWQQTWNCCTSFIYSVVELFLRSVVLFCLWVHCAMFDFSFLCQFFNDVFIQRLL